MGDYYPQQHQHYNPSTPFLPLPRPFKHPHLAYRNHPSPFSVRWSEQAVQELRQKQG